MSWGAGGRSVDEMLHVAAVADKRRHAATRRAAALTIAGHLGPDCRDVLEACGLAPYLGHDINLNNAARPVWRGASGKIGSKQDGSQPRCVNTSTGSLTADSTPALPGGISG